MKGIPDPYYSLFETYIGSDPAIVVVNSALLQFAERKDFPWHLRIGVHCAMQGENGMPTAEEVDSLSHLERLIEPAIQSDDNAIFLARITARGERVLLYRVRNPERANETLQALISVSEPLREWEYQMEHDADWLLAQPELELVIQASTSD
ncbi:DUF695 domain-containing protein [Stenotrophomonas sp. PD6]|uniref:DUF695 domain-containing protein n=1 Tax=Stenotrophomonas sp. PD6 TaxID=3368612 RepID=UPI003B9F0C19